MKLLYLFILNLVFTCVVRSQGNSMHFTTVNGLPHDITYGIFQDKDGFIWIGTDDGLVKYDGQEFKIFTTDDGLRNNFIIDINQTRNGDIVLATWGGGLQVIRNDKVIRVDIKNDENEKINNIQIWNNDLIVKSGIGNVLYQKTNTGYHKKLLVLDNYKLQKNNFNKEAEGKSYIRVIENSLFFINDVKTLYQSIPKNEKGITKISNNKSATFINYFKNRVVNNVTKVANGKYIVSIIDSIFICDAHKILKKVKLNLGKENNIITEVSQKNNGYYFLATNTKGAKNVYFFSNNFDLEIDFKKLFRLDVPISDFLIDNEQNVWITTNGNGVFCYNANKKNKILNRKKLPEVSIVDIEQIDNKKYLLTPNYLISFSDTVNVSSDKLNGFGKVLTVIDKKNLIISSLNIEKVVTKGIRKEVPGFNVINLGTKKNIYVSDSIYIEYFNKKIPTNKRVIYDAVFYKDSLWFASNIGMFYYDTQKQDLVLKTISNFKLPSQHIKKFILKDKTLWIATNKGLSKIYNNKLYNYSQKNGLISNQINSMVIDHNGKLWIGTNRGISIFDQKNFINLNVNSGLISPFINIIYETAEKEILIGTDKGLTVIDNTISIKLENQPLLNVKQNNSKFSYIAISYNHSNALIVQYKLNNSNWITLYLAKGNLDFSNQKKGNYTIQFRAKKQDGVWGYSKKYTFRNTIPIYKDPVYILIAIAILSFLFIFLILNQLKSVKKRNLNLKSAIEKQKKLEEELSKVRENIAQDFHDDFGNKLARISLLSNLAANDSSFDNEKVKEKIAQIESDANYLYKGTRDFIFSLNSESDNLEQLVTYLSDFGEDLFYDSGKRFVINKQLVSDTKLPYYWSKQLIFIFKEALTNAYKHSDGTNVTLNFVYLNSVLTICCIDNGKGFTFIQKKNGSNGLNNMKKRAEKIGGTLSITFDNNETSIIFSAKTT